MLAHNQLPFLFPRNAVDLRTTRPNRCLFGSPDVVETRILVEEQFDMDRTYMLGRYGFDIAKGTPVTSVSSFESEEEAETETVEGSRDRQNSCAVPVATNEEVRNHGIPNSEVRNRSGRYSPYRQKRITGKRQCVRNSAYELFEFLLSVPTSVVISSTGTLRCTCKITPYSFCVHRIILAVSSDCFQVIIIGLLVMETCCFFSERGTESLNFGHQPLILSRLTNILCRSVLSIFKCSNTRKVQLFVCNSPLAKLERVCN
jgi:hypothetical protein